MAGLEVFTAVKLPSLLLLNSPEGVAFAKYLLKVSDIKHNLHTLAQLHTAELWPVIAS